MRAQTIDDVITLLDQRIDRAQAEGSPLGYFPALYRKVTRRVKVGIEKGEFEDGPRMELLDVVFANRYLDAANALDNAAAASRSWKVAFDAAQVWPPLVLQHLLLGMNAHINLDLGAAAAVVAPGDALPALRRDFDHINVILASLMGGVKNDLVAIWPTLGFFDKALGTTDDAIANFSMRKARDAAWGLAQTLATSTQAVERATIAATDAEVATFGRLLWRPGVLIQAPALVVRAMERGTVRSKIDLLVT